MQISRVIALVVSVLFCSQALSLSEGCNTVNGLSVLPASAAVINFGASRVYAAGEVIRFSATTPGATTSLAVEQDGTVVATGGFPGTLSYRIPSSGSFTIKLITIPNASVTFTSASCVAGSTAGVPATPAWSLVLLALALLLLTFFRFRQKKIV